MTGRRPGLCPWSGRRSRRRPCTIACFCVEHHPPAGLSLGSAGDFPSASSTEHGGQGGSFHGPWAKLNHWINRNGINGRPGCSAARGVGAPSRLRPEGGLTRGLIQGNFSDRLAQPRVHSGPGPAVPDIGGASCRTGTARLFRQPQTSGSPGSHPDHARSVWYRNYQHFIRHGRDPPQRPDFQTCLGIPGWAPNRNECNCRKPVTSALEERPVTPGAGRRNPQDRPLQRAQTTAATGSLVAWYASHADHGPPSDLASRRPPPQSRLGRRPGRINGSRSVPVRRSTGSPTTA